MGRDHRAGPYSEGGAALGERLGEPVVSDCSGLGPWPAGGQRAERASFLGFANRVGRMVRPNGQTDSTGPDGEIRQLRAMAAALRAELEAAADAQALAGRQVIVEREQDRREARQSVEALRSELEGLRFEHDAAVAAANRAAEDALSQARLTVEALRGELERQAADHTAALADQDREFRDERKQLTSMITALRAQLEECRGR